MRAVLFFMAFMLCFQGSSADKDFIKRIEAKMKKVIIPELKADEVEEFIEEFMGLYLKHTPDKVGVCFTYRSAQNTGPGQPIPDAPKDGDDPFGDDPFGDDPFGDDPFGDDPFGDPMSEKQPRKTERPPNHKYKYHYKNMNSLELVKQFAKDAGLRFKMGSKLILADPSVQIDDMVTKFYLLDKMDIEEGLKKFLESKGVQFNAGAQLAYLPKVNRLVLTNTEEAQNKVMEILNPLMVEKAMKLIIPRFKQSEVALDEVIEALMEEVKKHDDTLNVRFEFKQPKRVKVEEKDPGEDPFGDDPFGEPGVPDTGKPPKDESNKVYKFDFENMPIGEIIRYICISSNLKYRVEGRTVVISEPNMIHYSGSMKSYDAYNNEMKKDPEKFFKKNGVLLGVGEAAAYNQEKEKIIVFCREEVHRRINAVMDVYKAEKIYVEKIRELINEKRLKDAGNLLNIVLWDNPLNNEAMTIYLQLLRNNSYGEDQLYTEYPKALKAVLPEVKFEDAEVEDVLEFLSEKSKQLDKEKRRIRFVLDVEDPEPIEDPDDPFAEPVSQEDQKISKDRRLINLDAENIPLQEVVKYICEQIGLVYRVEPFAVILKGKVHISELETRFYKVPPKLLKFVNFNKDADYKVTLEKAGISFPPGSKVKYVKNDTKIIFTNVENNHKLLEFMINIFKN